MVIHLCQENRFWLLTIGCPSSWGPWIVYEHYNNEITCKMGAGREKMTLHRPPRPETSHMTYIYSPAYCTDMDRHGFIQGEIIFSLYSFYAKHRIAAGTLLTALSALKWTILPKHSMPFLFSHQNKLQVWLQNNFLMSLTLICMKYSHANGKSYRP